MTQEIPAYYMTFYRFMCLLKYLMRVVYSYIKSYTVKVTSTTVQSLLLFIRKILNVEIHDFFKN